MTNSRFSALNSMPPVVKNLLAINIILWLATAITPTFFKKFGLDIDLTDILGLHYWASHRFNPAQLLTYMFMHGGFFHLFFNMFALYMFGAPLEYSWGSKKFLLYYLVAGLGAGIIQELVWTAEFQSLVNAMDKAIEANSGEGLLVYQNQLSKIFRFGNLAAFDASSIEEMKQLLVNLPVTIGASGSIFGLLLAFGWLFPQVQLFFLFIPVPIRARLAVTIYAVAELFFGVVNFTGDNIAHFAHLGGMLFGAVLLLYWRKKR